MGMGLTAPPVEEAAKDSDKAVTDLIKEVRTIGGNSGRKNAAVDMTDADEACYSAKYGDLGKTNPKEHYRTVGAE